MEDGNNQENANNVENSTDDAADVNNLVDNANGVDNTETGNVDNNNSGCNPTEKGEASIDVKGVLDLCDLAICDKNDLIITLLQEMTCLLKKLDAKLEANKANPAYCVMPDLTDRLAKFKGTEPRKEAEWWLQMLESYSVIYNWPDKIIITFAHTKLEDSALSWYMGCKDSIKTWKEFKEQFHKAFIHEETKIIRWEKMYKRVQKKDESMVTYYLDKYFLCKRLDLPWEEIKVLILQGLINKDLSCSLMVNEHEDWQVLMRCIRNYEDFVECRRTNFPDENKQDNEQPSTSNDQAQNGNNRRIRVKCYNCNRFNHLSRDCPEPKRQPFCTACRTRGHSRRNCRAQNNDDEPIEAVAFNIELCPTKNEPSNPFVKTASINNECLSALLDTGTDLNMMKASAAKLCGIELNETKIPIYGFGDMKEPCTYSLGESCITLKVDHVSIPDVKVIVVPDETQKYDILIGRSWLHHPEVNYFRKGNQIILEKITHNSAHNLNSNKQSRNIDNIISKLENIKKSYNYELKSGTPNPLLLNIHNMISKLDSIVSSSLST